MNIDAMKHDFIYVSLESLFNRFCAMRLLEKFLGLIRILFIWVRSVIHTSG